ncbi:hypothetical protein [Bradyrhizobium sp.]
MKAAISLDAALGRLVFDLDQVQRDFADAAMKEAANRGGLTQKRLWFHR